MAELTVQDITPAGKEITLTAAAEAGDTFDDDGKERTILVVANGSGSSIDVTVSAAKTSTRVQGVGSIAVPDIKVAVAAGDTLEIGPFADAYRGAGGAVAVGYSAVTTVTVGVKRLSAVGL